MPELKENNRYNISLYNIIENKKLFKNCKIIPKGSNYMVEYNFNIFGNIRGNILDHHDTFSKTCLTLAQHSHVKGSRNCCKLLFYESDYVIVKYCIENNKKYKM